MLRAAPPRIHVNKMKFHRSGVGGRRKANDGGKNYHVPCEEERGKKSTSKTLSSQEDFSIVFDFLLSQPLFTADGTWDDKEASKRGLCCAVREEVIKEICDHDMRSCSRAFFCSAYTTIRLLNVSHSIPTSDNSINVKCINFKAGAASLRSTKIYCLSMYQQIETRFRPRMGDESGRWRQ